MKTNLGLLPTDERPLATAQKLCPITGKPLGSMGKPFKLTLGDQPVFLCCDGCEDRAKENADRTLAKIKELKSKARGDKSNHP